MPIYKLPFLFILIFLSFSGFSQEQDLIDTITVAADGSGDYTSIQDAIYTVEDKAAQRTTIFIKSGIYLEKVRIPVNKPNISLVGESLEGTIISNADHSGKRRHIPDDDGNPNFRTFSSYTLRVEGQGFTAENLTIRNTAGEVGQAVALHVHADQAAFKNCRILGNQDTLYVSLGGARSYFENCYITGTTDFIFGAATALFENCRIVSIKNSYITAAATPESELYGLVFSNCSIERLDKSVDAVYLGRPWRPFAKTVFVNCDLDEHIRPEGWHNWGKESNEKTAFYAEYQCKGPGAQHTDKRVGWSHQLKAEDFSKYTRANILRDWEPATIQE